MSPLVDSAGATHLFGSTGLRGDGVVQLANVAGGWTEDTLTYPPEKGTDALIWAGLDTDGTIWLAYMRWSIFNPCFYVCPHRRSRFDGLHVMNNATGSWSEPTKLPERLEQSGASLAVHEGVLHAAYSVRVRGRAPSESEDVVYAANQLGTWEYHDLGPGGSPKVALDSVGHPWITFNTGIHDGTRFWLAFAQEGEFTTIQIPGVQSAVDSGVTEVLIDQSDRPLIIFYRWDRGHGYRSFAILRDGSDWGDARFIADRYLDDAVLSPSGSLHALYHLSEMENMSDDGLWYASLMNGVPTSRQLNDSCRSCFADGPDAPQTLTVDSLGRPHVFYSTPHDEGEEATWYMVGPPL